MGKSDFVFLIPIFREVGCFTFATIEARGDTAYRENFSGRAAGVDECLHIVAAFGEVLLER